MAEDIERKVVYVYSVVDQMSKEHERMASSAKKAGDESARTTDAQKALAEEVRHTSDEISSQASLASSKASDISSAMTDAEASAKRAGDATEDTITKQRELASTAQRTTAEVQAQNVSVIMQLTAIMGFRQGISSLTNSMISLGLVSDESAAKLLKFNSAFQMFSGGVQILKAAQGMMTILNASTLKNAILNTYNSVITNPGRAALVGVGIGAAAGVGAYYALSSSNSTTVSNTVTIQGTPTAGQEQTAQKVQQVYSLTGAGGYA